MARGRSNNRASHGDGGGAIHFANMAINKEDEYKHGVKNLQIRAKMTAELLTAGGDIETFLMEADPDNAESFLSEQRNRLKGIAEGNAKHMNEIENFVQAVKDVRSDIQRQNQGSTAAAGDDGEGEEAAADADKAPDYERAIQDAIEKVREAKESNPNQASLEDHDMVLELREKLGEKVKKRSRDDDDLEIVDNVGSDDVHALKCPITGMFFEEPVRSKVCGHTYDRKGLNQLFSMRKTKCPIPGCSNNALSLNQVEVDDEMKLKVRRHKTREEAAKKKRDLDETMDDDDEQGGGYTVLE